jgi:hypothetical protein
MTLILPLMARYGSPMHRPVLTCAIIFSITWNSDPQADFFPGIQKPNETRVHLEGLGFANGVALGPDEAYILVNETMFYRITRYWIKGEKSGQTDIFIENLPGFPDNLTYNKNGLFWVALIYPRQEKIDSLLPKTFLAQSDYATSRVIACQRT